MAHVFMLMVYVRRDTYMIEPHSVYTVRAQHTAAARERSSAGQVSTHVAVYQ